MRRRIKSFFSRIVNTIAENFARTVVTAVREGEERQFANSAVTRQSEPVNPKIAEPTSEALTQGIRVVVQSMYLPDQSSPEDEQYTFAYTVAIANEGSAPAQLRTRHWVITDAKGDVRDVKGDGVVGKQPLLQPGEAFEYTSGCVLATPVGTMEGTYQMFRDDGSQFDAVIAPFTLASPLFRRDRILN